MASLCGSRPVTAGLCGAKRGENVAQKRGAIDTGSSSKKYETVVPAANSGPRHSKTPPLASVFKHGQSKVVKGCTRL